MGVELFSTILQQVAPLTEEVCLHLMGEPLAHPHFKDIVQICQDTQVKVNLTTNGILLPRYESTIRLNPSLKQINFSLHSFHDNFANKDIVPYLQQIFHFTQLCLEQRPDLYINYRLWNLSKHPVEDSNKQILQAIADFFQVELPIAEAIDVTWKKGLKLKGRLYLNFDTQFTWPSLKSPVRSQVGFCHALSTHIGIHADGTVVPCCLDKEAGVSLGQCSQQSLESIINGDRAIKMQDGFRNFRLEEDLCQRCTFIDRFDKKVIRATKKIS